MKTYEISLRHDSGSVTIRTRASNIETAMKMVCDAEKAPLGAIKHWRVVPTARQIKRTQSLLRSL